MSKITFVCPCYNHEKYVLNFLNSLLDQTCSDWELLLFDDCSTDQTVSLIKTISDERIHLIQNPYNKGMAYSLLNGITSAKTDLISFIASDDALYPEYVETVLNAFQGNPKISACYTPLQIMDQDGNVLPKKQVRLPSDKTQEQIFADMFLNKNLLPSPGMVFRKSAIKPYLPLNIGLIQFTDWQLHFFLMCQGSIKLLNKPVVKYRISPGSASAFSIPTILREKIETPELMNTIVQLIGKNANQFKKFFGNNDLIKDKKILPETIPFWLGRLALTSSLPNKQEWGLQTIMNFISVEENMALLNKLYGFSFKDYMIFAKQISDSRIEAKLQKCKKKIKQLKNIIYTLLIILVILLIWRIV